MTYGLKNNATSKLTAGISSSATSVSITVGEGQLFINNSVATLESRNSDGDVVKREIVLISGISGDTLTIERAYGPCVVDDTAEDKEMQAVAQSFSAGDTLSIYLASEVIQDLYTPAQQVASLCTCICNCHDTRMQQAKQKMIDCYGDISYGTGCDGDCVISGCVYLDATKEYEFRNLTICAGACVRFVGSGIPKIHVQNKFCNLGTIDLRGGCAVGTNSFTNCFGTISNNYCATCYNAMCYGCGGKGGCFANSQCNYHGGNGGNADVNGGTGEGGCCRSCNGCDGGIGCGGGGGGSRTQCGCAGEICNGGCGGFYCTNTMRVYYGEGGGGGGGGYREGRGGEGGCVYARSCCMNTGGHTGGNGGNGGIWGKGGNGGNVCALSFDSVCTCPSYTDTCGRIWGGCGGNGYCGGNGGDAGTSLRAGRDGVYGGRGGNGVVCGGNGGKGTNNKSGYNCYIDGGKGGDAINNMYGLALRAKCFYNASGDSCVGIIGIGGQGGKGGDALYGSSVCSCTCYTGGNGGKGADGAKIMIFYKVELNAGFIGCAGGCGGSGGRGGRVGTAGTNGAAGCLIYCQRNV